jgi:hypothetical protein
VRPSARQRNEPTSSRWKSEPRRHRCSHAVDANNGVLA